MDKHNDDTEPEYMFPRELTDNFEADDTHVTLAGCPRDIHTGWFRDGYCPSCHMDARGITQWHTRFVDEHGRVR